MKPSISRRGAMKSGLIAGLTILGETSEHKAYAASNYNRNKALAYARKYWNKVCSDGYVAVGKSPFFIAIPAGTEFQQKYANGVFEDEWVKKPDGGVIKLSEGDVQLDDCTHFISSCLGNPPNDSAGGLHIRSDFNTIYGCLGANKLFTQLKADGLIQVVAERQPFSQAASHIGSLQAGDLIFYCEDQHPYHHSAMYMDDSKKRIACHSYCRSDVTDNFPQQWNHVGSYNKCTLAKIL